MSKRMKNNIVLAVVIIAVVALLGTLSSGFTDWKVSEWLDRDRNPDNLIQTEDITLKSGKHSSGVEIKVKDDGSIVLNGKAGVDAEVTYCTVALSAGDYVLSGAESGSSSTYYLATTVSSNAVMGDFPGTFTVSDQTTLTIKLVIKEGTSFFNTTIRPVVNEGSDAADFYAD